MLAEPFIIIHGLLPNEARGEGPHNDPLSRASAGNVRTHTSFSGPGACPGGVLISFIPAKPTKVNPRYTD